MSSEPEKIEILQAQNISDFIDEIFQAEVKLAKTILTQSPPYPISSNQEEMDKISTQLKVIEEKPSSAQDIKNQMSSLLHFLAVLRESNEQMNIANTDFEHSEPGMTNLFARIQNELTNMETLFTQK